MLIAQGEEVGGGHQGVVDGVQRLARAPRVHRHSQRGPMAGLPAGGDGPHLVGVDRVRRRLHPLPQAAGDGLLDGQEGHHVDEVLDLQTGQVVVELEERGHLGRQPVVAAPLAAAVPPLRQADDGVGPAGRAAARDAAAQPARRPSGGGRSR